MNKTSIGVVKEWHDPRNNDCPHNGDIGFSCNCKRPQKRKPYRVVKVTDHGVRGKVSPYLIFEIWPNGALTMREKGRRKRFTIAASSLYSCLMQWEAKAWSERKKKARLAKRAFRRKAHRSS